MLTSIYKYGAALINKKHGFQLLLAVAVVVLTLASCEKVIDVKLDNADKKYVIEANLTDQPGSAKVLLTQTKDFNEDNNFNGISGAQVTITDNGTVITLAETAPGIYQAPALTGVPGHTYQLSVTVNGQNFTSVTVMPAKVPWDSLFITESEFFGEKTKYATVVYTDPAGIKNGYRFIQYVNGNREETLFIRDDDSNDGLKVERTLFYFYDDDEEDERALKSGDKVKIEMLGISYPIYKYWYSLDQSATGESDSATPGNPVSNIKGGALGYFSAHTVQSKTVVVP